MNFVSRKPSGRRGFDMTPMIDVVLQLIIFFMFTSRFGEVTRTLVELPKQPGEQEPQTERPTLVLDISERGSMLLDARPITHDAFLAVVEREIEHAGGDASAVDLLIRAHRRGAAGTLNRLAESLAAMEVRSWRLGTAATSNEGGAAP